VALTHTHIKPRQPGDGKGYVRHMDYSKGRNINSRGRKLTAILYLNEEWEGGQLRVHLPNIAVVPTAMFSLAAIVPDDIIHDNQGLNDSVLATSSSAGYLDLDPVMGRLVIFRRLD
jgi:2OG-Fe(II) oxygenase superfamily